jgi:hypothetical protein
MTGMRLIPRFDEVREYASNMRDTAREQGEAISRAVRTNTVVVAVVGLLALVALALGIRALGSS